MPARPAGLIRKRVRRLLVAQVGHELGAHQAYLGISLYFERCSLTGWAKLFHDQALEEAGHAAKIMTFLIDNEVRFDLPALTGAPTGYKSAREAVEAVLASEIRVTGQFHALASAARAAEDYRSVGFLQWFIEEQVEEERTMRALLDLVAGSTDLFQAQAFLEDIA